MSATHALVTLTLTRLQFLEVLPSEVEVGRARMEMMEMESETMCGVCGHFSLLFLLDAADVGRRPPELRVPVARGHRL